MTEPTFPTGPDAPAPSASLSVAVGRSVAAATAAAGGAARELARWSGQRRREVLHAIADALAASAEPIVETAVAETGLTRQRLDGELARTTGQLRLLGDFVAAGRDRPVVRSAGAAPGGGDIVAARIPIGPVAVFAASNFPLAFGVAGGDTASALAAGCPVVAKAHPAQPETARLVAEAVAKALDEQRAPAATFAVVHGGVDVSLDLVRAPEIRAVGFTGSPAGGRALMDAAAARPDPIPVYAEMGSLNPVFVFPSALDDPAWPATLAGAVTGSAGQLCTKPGLVVVPDTPAGAAFADRLVAAIAETPPFDRMLTPAMARAHATWHAQTFAPSGGSHTDGAAAIREDRGGMGGVGERAGGAGRADRVGLGGVADRAESAAHVERTGHAGLADRGRSLADRGGMAGVADRTSATAPDAAGSPATPAPGTGGSAPAATPGAGGSGPAATPGTGGSAPAATPAAGGFGPGGVPDAARTVVPAGPGASTAARTVVPDVGAAAPVVPFAVRVAADQLDGDLVEEHFGPTVVVATSPVDRYAALLDRLAGSLTATVVADAADDEAVRDLLPLLAERAGRVIYNGVPTGVAVVDAMNHGGPWPATSGAFTSVGTGAVERFLRTVALQGLPPHLFAGFTA